MLLLILAGVFAGTVSVCVGAYLWLNRERLAAAETARARLLAELEIERSRSILRDTSASELELLDRLLAGKGITAHLAHELQAAGLETKPGTFLLVTGIAAASGMIAGSVAGALATDVGLVAGGLAPYVVLKIKQRRRLAAFQEQLPEAIDMLVSAMQAGYSFQMAMRFIGEEIAEPLGPEFMRFHDEQRLGMDVRATLLALEARIRSMDLRMFVTAVLIQRETGGNLGEVLSNIADVMRQRADVHRQIETMTAQSKMAGRMLAALPVLVFLAIWTLDPEFMRPMLESGIGQLLLGYAVLSVAVGYWLLMRIATIDV